MIKKRKRAGRKSVGKKGGFRQMKKNPWKTFKKKKNKKMKNFWRSQRKK